MLKFFRFKPLTASFKMEDRQKIPLKSSQEQAEILGIHLNGTSKGRVPAFVRGRLRHFDTSGSREAKFFIVTPNPEIIMMAQKDRELIKILNSADLALADGVGLAQAAKFLELPNPRNALLRPITLFLQGMIVGLATFFRRDWLLSSLNLIKGREMFLELIKLANKKAWRVYLLGGEDGVAEEVSIKLRRSLKKIQIQAADGPMIDEEASPITKNNLLVEKEAVSMINKFKPHLLFVAFGAPKQEKWAYKWLPKLNIGGTMVVGGTFDYISGRVSLPPRWMQKFGLEWFWRLIAGPTRFRRILAAFPIFPLKIFWCKLRQASFTKQRANK